MAGDDELVSLFERAAGRVGPSTIFPATVKAINADDYTATIVFAEGHEVDDARLKSVVSDKGSFVVFPKINTVVQVARIENSQEWIVVAVDEVDRVEVKIGQVLWEITSQGVSVKKGADSLKTALVNIIQAVQQIVVLQGNNPNYAKLNQALNSIQNLLV